MAEKKPKEKPKKFFHESHVIPFGDTIKHTHDENCVCSPMWDVTNQWEHHEKKSNHMIWIHRRIKDIIQ